MVTPHRIIATLLLSIVILGSWVVVNAHAQGKENRRLLVETLLKREGEIRARGEALTQLSQFSGISDRSGDLLTLLSGAWRASSQARGIGPRPSFSSAWSAPRNPATVTINGKEFRATINVGGNTSLAYEGAISGLRIKGRKRTLNSIICKNANLDVAFEGERHPDG